MDRPLFTLAQFAEFVGEQVKIRLRSPVEDAAISKGLIRSVEDQDVVISGG